MNQMNWEAGTVPENLIFKRNLKLSLLKNYIRLFNNQITKISRNDVTNLLNLFIHQLYYSGERHGTMNDAKIIRKLLDRADGKNIDGVAGDKTLANQDALVFQCLNAASGWIIIGSYVVPM